MRIFKGSVAAAAAVSLVGIAVGAALIVRAIGKALEDVIWSLDDEDDTPEARFELDPLTDFEAHCQQLLDEWGVHMRKENERLDAAWKALDS